MLFLCGAGVISLVVAAVIIMVSTIYQMAERDEQRLVNEASFAAGRKPIRPVPEVSY